MPAVLVWDQLKEGYIFTTGLRNSKCKSKRARFRAQQPSKTNLSKLSSESGTWTLFRAWQHLKAHHPMLVTESGILMLSKALHVSNALSPMLVTEFGISIAFRAVHPLKASLPMLSTDFGILMLSWRCLNQIFYPCIIPTIPIVFKCFPLSL